MYDILSVNSQRSAKYLDSSAYNSKRNSQLHKTDERAKEKTQSFYFSKYLREMHAATGTTFVIQKIDRAPTGQATNKCKDSQHDCRIVCSWCRRRTHVIVIFYFSFFSLFCSPGMYTQRFAIVGPAGTFSRTTTFVSGVNFRSAIERIKRVYSCQRKNQLEINPRCECEIKLHPVNGVVCSIDGRVIPKYIVQSVYMRTKNEIFNILA